MSEVYIVVEGATEQTFVRDVLAPYMASYKGVHLHSSIIGRPGHKGGDVRIDRAMRDIIKFLKQRTDVYVSTMFDFFRINTNWPGMEELRQKIKTGVPLSPSQKAACLENATLEYITNAFSGAKNRFIPYIEMHEFEALLFSNADILSQNSGIPIESINSVLSGYPGPEYINDTPEKAPSKRLTALDPAYRKVAMGKTIAKATGIDTIRQKCPHFNDWLTKLEGLRKGNRK